VAGENRDLKTSDDVEHRENRDADLTQLENELRAADAEISDTLEELSTLRTRVVRVSVESEESTAQMRPPNWTRTSMLSTFVSRHCAPLCLSRSLLPVASVEPPQIDHSQSALIS